MNLFVFTKAWLMHINAWILLILPCITKHISDPQNTPTHMHTHMHTVCPTKKEEKKVNLSWLNIYGILLMVL